MNTLNQDVMVGTLTYFGNDQYRFSACTCDGDTCDTGCGCDDSCSNDSCSCDDSNFGSCGCDDSCTYDMSV